MMELVPNDVHVYYSYCAGIISVSLGWTEPNYWIGTKASWYQSFDSSAGLVLMEGSQAVCHIPLVSGKVKSSFFKSVSGLYTILGFQIIPLIYL